MNHSRTHYPTLKALEALFQNPTGSFKKIQRATSFRELLTHYLLPFYLLTLLGAMIYYFASMKSPLTAIARGISGPFLFWSIFTLFIYITGAAIAAGASHFGVHIKKITGQNLIALAFLPALALAPLYFLGFFGKLAAFSGILYSFILIYHGSKLMVKIPPEGENIFIISVYGFILVFAVVFFAIYMLLLNFIF